MFCTECGIQSPEGAHFCANCGAALSTLPPPLANRSPAIWNPNAAACWSLLLTPMFGAYLQAQNWHALGKPEQEKTSMRWFYLSVAYFVVHFSLVKSNILAETPRNILDLLSVVYLLVWYFAAARVQARYVTAHFGVGYLRRPWAKTLLTGLGILVALCISINFVLRMYLGFAT